MQSETGVQALRADIRTPMKKLSLTTSNLWNLSMLNPTLLSFQL